MASSIITMDSTVTVEVVLPKGIVTNYNPLNMHALIKSASREMIKDTDITVTNSTLTEDGLVTITGIDLDSIASSNYAGIVHTIKVRYVFPSAAHSNDNATTVLGTCRVKRVVNHSTVTVIG